MQIKVNGKWDTIRELVNTWLKENKKYCNNCGMNYFPNNPACCDNPQIGTNIQHTGALVKALKEIRNTRDNIHASNKTNTMRWGVSLPPRLYKFLDDYLTIKYNERLFQDNIQIRQFAKKFPEFCVPEKI